MTSATIRHARGASHGESYGMIVFAAVLLWVVGIFNVIDGTAAIARSSVFIGGARYVAAIYADGAGSPSSSARCRSSPGWGYWSATRWPAGSRSP